MCNLMQFRADEGGAGQDSLVQLMPENVREAIQAALEARQVSQNGEEGNEGGQTGR